MGCTDAEQSCWEFGFAVSAVESVTEFIEIFLQVFSGHAVKGAQVEYLQKPFTPKALAHKIREVLDRPLAVQSAAA